MKRQFMLSLGLFLGAVLSFAQEESPKPIILKPVYFDISPPLIDMMQQDEGTVDLSWKEGIVKNKLNTRSNDQSVANDQFVDPIRQSVFGDNVASDTTIQNFDGVGANGSYPPDTDGDVSPSHYMQIVNTRYAIYDKNGNKLAGPTSNSQMFSGLPNNSNDGDGILLYDENADRWLFSQFSLPNYPNGPFYENVAISQTNNPLGSWYRYQFQFADMPDYPKLAVWVDGYYMTIRRFSSGSGNWISPSAVAMDRAKMLAGDPTASMVMFHFPSSAEGTQAADCDSDFPPMGTPCPVAYLTSTATSTMRIYDFAVNWANPTASTFTLTNTITLTPFSYWGPSSGNTIPQKNTSQKLDAMSGKRIMFRMPYRKFPTYSSMLVNTTVNVSGVAGIRWLEVRHDGSTWSLYQEGTYAPGDGLHRWMGSIAMDAASNIALGYSISSSTMFPSIRYTGRLAGDPLGQMTVAEKGIINGGGSQTNTDGRWGDYSAMSADPSEVGKFWYTQEYYSATSSANWKTRIASFSFSNILSAVATAVPNPVCLGDSTQLQVTPNGGSGNYTYSWASIPPGFTSTLQNPKASPAVPTKYIVTTNDGSSTRQDTVSVTLGYDPTVFAGADTVVCWYVTEVELHGSCSNYKQFGWSSTGSGSFTNNATLETSYLPSLADKLNGYVDLKLVAVPNLPCQGNITSIKRVTFDQCTGTGDLSSDTPALFIQPNPAQDQVTIAVKGIPAGSGTLTIATIAGKVLFTENIRNNSNTLTRNIDLAGYPKGVYFVQFSSGSAFMTQKLIVK